MQHHAAVRTEVSFLILREARTVLLERGSSGLHARRRRGHGEAHAKPAKTLPGGLTVDGPVDRSCHWQRGGELARSHNKDKTQIEVQPAVTDIRSSAALASECEKC